MSRLKALGLLGWGVCVATILALASFGAVYGEDGFQQQFVWFLGYNVFGYVVFFIAYYLHEVWRAPGALLQRDVYRDLVKQHLAAVRKMLADGGRLVETVKLNGATDATRSEFEKWVNDCHAYFEKDIASMVDFFDDPDPSGLGVLLDVSREMGPPFGRQRTAEHEAKSTLLDLIAQRRANLQRISDILAPTVLSGEWNPRRR